MKFAVVQTEVSAQWSRLTIQTIPGNIDGSLCMKMTIDTLDKDVLFKTGMAINRSDTMDNQITVTENAGRNNITAISLNTYARSIIEFEWMELIVVLL